jgi:ABC-type multidrug transport system permease subunit
LLRSAADAIRNLFVLCLMTGVGAAAGSASTPAPRPPWPPSGLPLAVGIAFSWINALLGLLVRDAESAGLAGLLAVIPLIFTGSTFVPVATMPG